MKIAIQNCWHKRKKKKELSDLVESVKNNVKDDPQIWRDLLAYWILGLCTEFGYVVIISAAHDILNRFETSNNDAEKLPSTNGSLSDYQQVCETQSTGVLLVADIVPSMFMNMLCPFLPLIKNYRMMLVIILNLSSFLLIANTDDEYLAISGVIFTSLALGIGEVTLLSYSAKFNKKVIAAWSSGTGSSGIIGSVSWAALIEFGFNPRVTMRFMLIVPIIEAFTFWFLLRSPREKILKDNSNKINIATIESNLCPSSDCVLPNLDVKLSGLKAKLKCLPSLAPYICPLVLVFIFEYICVSGLFEMIYVRDIWMDHRSQYRWFQVAYQMGVFTSRSMGTLLKPRRTWWAPIVQCIITCYFMHEASTKQTASLYILFSLVFSVGIVGGLCFVHTFQRLIKELPKNQHKFSLGMITIAESVGVAIGGFLAIPIHDIICQKYLE